MTCVRSAPIALAVASAVLVFAACDFPFEPMTAIDSPEHVEGTWRITSYASDDDGCAPQSATAAYEHVQIERNADGKLELVLCPTRQTCGRATNPRQLLDWLDDRDHAETIHHRAELVEANGLEPRCRLTSQRRVLVADGRNLELTKSFYETLLPVDEPDACNDELVEEHRPHLPCVRSETYLLVTDNDGG